MFRWKSINSCFMVLTLCVASQIYQLQGAQNAADTESSLRQKLTRAEQAAINQLLFEAVKFGDIDTIQNVINDGAQVNATDEMGYFALHWAATRATANFINVLLDAGADIRVLSINSYALLHHATPHSFTRVVELLLEHFKIDINAQNEYGERLLDLVIMRNNVKAMELLINDFRIDFRVANKEGQTPLNLAINLNKIEIIKLLIENLRIDINANNNKGQTLLNIAMQQNKPKIVKMLLLAGAYIAPWLRNEIFHKIPLPCSSFKIHEKLERYSCFNIPKEPNPDEAYVPLTTLPENLANDIDSKYYENKMDRYENEMAILRGQTPLAKVVWKIYDEYGNGTDKQTLPKLLSNSDPRLNFIRRMFKQSFIDKVNKLFIFQVRQNYPARPAAEQKVKIDAEEIMEHELHKMYLRFADQYPTDALSKLQQDSGYKKLLKDPAYQKAAQRVFGEIRLGDVQKLNEHERTKFMQSVKEQEERQALLSAQPKLKEAIERHELLYAMEQERVKQTAAAH